MATRDSSQCQAESTKGTSSKARRFKIPMAHIIRKWARANWISRESQLHWWNSKGKYYWCRRRRCKWKWSGNSNYNTMTQMPLTRHRRLKLWRIPVCGCQGNSKRRRFWIRTSCWKLRHKINRYKLPIYPRSRARKTVILHQQLKLIKQTHWASKKKRITLTIHKSTANHHRHQSQNPIH